MTLNDGNVLQFREEGFPAGADSQIRKRRRAARACLNCRERKVRCDATTHEGSCTNCQLDSLVCTMKDGIYRTSRWIHSSKRSWRGDVLSTKAIAAETATSPSYSSRSNPCQTITSLPTHIEDSLEVNQWLDPVQQPSPEPFGGVENRRAVNDESTCVEHSRAKFSVAAELPSYIRPLSSELDEDDLAYLKKKGALRIPPAKFRDHLIQNFLENIYGYLPIINAREFVEIIYQGDGLNGKISLLLLQAVLFTGAAFAAQSELLEAGYQTKRQARQELFHRARLLYDLNVEQARTPLIQSTLLLTYWHSRRDQKDLHYWIGSVVTLAHASGLYHCPEADNATDSDNRLSRRLWWSMFSRDQQIAVGTRRPARMRIERHCVSMLTLEDFEFDAIPNSIDVLSPSCIIARDITQQRQLAAMCIEQCKLSVCINKILSSQFIVTTNLHPTTEYRTSVLAPKKDSLLASQDHPLQHELDEWVAALPNVCKYDSVSAVLGYESRVMIIHKAVLRMMYLTAVFVLHHPRLMPSAPWSTATSPLSETAENLQDVTISRIRQAAGETSKIGKELQSLDLIHLLPPTAISSFVPAMIVHLMDIRYGQGPSPTLVSQQYSECSRILRKLMESYVSAEMAMDFLEDTSHAADIRVDGENPSIGSSRNGGKGSLPSFQIDSSLLSDSQDLQVVDGTSSMTQHFTAESSRDLQGPSAKKPGDPCWEASVVTRTSTPLVPEFFLETLGDLGYDDELDILFPFESWPELQ